jgi:hypothetical protein
MASRNQKSKLAAIFTLEQQELISQIFNTKITEIIASGGLACSHCSSNSSSSSSSSSQLPWLSADSKVSVPTTPLQAFDKQLTTFKHQLKEQATKLQQFIDNHSCSEANISSPSTNSVAKNLSTSAHLIEKLAHIEQRVTDLENSFKQFESSIIQISNLDSDSRNVDYTRLLDEMHAKFETVMSKLQPALQQTISNFQQLESTNCKKSEVECNSDSRCKKALEQDANKLTVFVDRHEVLSTLVSNIGHEHNELAKFVQQLSQSTAWADDFVELKAVVECMARVTGVSEHKAEQLITQFIGKERVELEHLKREQRLADDKIRELQLARDQMKNMHDSPHQNQLPYLNFVTETVQRECEKYKHDLNAMAKSLSERVNAKVAQAIQQSLIDKHEQNNEAQFGLALTEGQDTKPEPSVATSSYDKIPTNVLQLVAENISTVLKAAPTAALQDETEPKRHQGTHTQAKDTAISSQARMPVETDSNDTRSQPEEQLSNLNKPLDVAVTSDSRSESPFEQVAEPWSRQQQTTTQQQEQDGIDDAMPRQSIWPIIKCVVVGHESAQALTLIQAYVDRRMGVFVQLARGGITVDEHVPVKNGTFNCKLCVSKCSEANQLNHFVCDIIVICFSVIDEVSYEDVRNVWIKRIKQVHPDKPYLVVGTQTDKREESGIRNFQVKYKQGLKLSQEIGAVAYFECSFLDAESVEIIFEYALQHFVDHKMTLLNMK